MCVTYVEGGCGEEDVCGLGDVGSVETVVVRHVSMVMVLQGHHVRDEGVDRDTKRLQQLSLLRREKPESSGTTSANTGTRQEARADSEPAQALFTWKMAYMMQLSGRLLANSATLNMLKLHLSRSSNSYFKHRPREQIKQTTKVYRINTPDYLNKPLMGKTFILSTSDLGELVLVVCVDAEARHRCAGEAGAVRQLPHAADVTHWLVFQGGRRDFHLVLLV